MTHISERYARATTTSRLKFTDEQGDIDVLTAAGWAGNSESPIAMVLYRMKHTGRPIGFHGVVSEMTDWIGRQAKAKAVRHAGHNTKLVVEKTIYWWLHNTCPNCGGRGHPNFPGTPVMKDDEDCPECLGEGIAPLSELIPAKHMDVAKMILNEVERVSSDAFARMKVALKD